MTTTPYCIGVGDWAPGLSVIHNKIDSCHPSRYWLSVVAYIATIISLIYIMLRMIQLKPERAKLTPFALASFAMLFCHCYLVPVVWIPTFRISNHWLVVLFVSLGVSFESFTVASMLNRTLQRAIRIPKEISVSKNQHQQRLLKLTVLGNWILSSLLSFIMFFGFMADGVFIKVDVTGIIVLTASIGVVCVCFMAIICIATYSLERLINGIPERHNSMSTFSHSEGESTPRERNQGIKRRLVKLRAGTCIIFGIACVSSFVTSSMPYLITMLLPILVILASTLNIVYISVSTETPVCGNKLKKTSMTTTSQNTTNP